jgi:hypothetical protein
VKSVDKFSSGKVHHQTAHHNHRQNHLASFRLIIPKPNILREAIPDSAPPPEVEMLEYQHRISIIQFLLRLHIIQYLHRLHIMIDGTVRHGATK